jgi:tetratricopeptide (TPR) repeat protein
MEHALAIAQKDRRAFNSTVNHLRRNQANIQIDLGHFADALATMEATPVPQVEGAYFIGTHYKALAEAYLGLGRLADAGAAIARGVDAMRDDKDDLAMAALIATRARVEAAAELPREAMADIERVLAVFGERGLGPENVRVLRARSIQAEVQLRSGAAVQAQAQLTQSLQTLRRALPSMSLEQAQVLSLLAAARLMQGDPQGALDAHREARTLLLHESPPDSLHLARNAFAIAVCGALVRPEAAATRDLTDRAAALTARLPADSAWVPLIARMTTAAASNPDVTRASALIF